MTRKWFGLLIVAGMAACSLLVLPALPAEIPIHWNPVDGPAFGRPGLFRTTPSGAEPTDSAVMRARSRASRSLPPASFPIPRACGPPRSYSSRWS